MMACNRRYGNSGTARSAIEIRSAGGFERGFIVVVCRACVDPPCARACPTNALRRRPGGGVILEENRCIGCKRCVEACTIGAVFWDEATEKPSICIHCGYCVEYCPYDVVKMEQVVQV